MCIKWRCIWKDRRTLSLVLWVQGWAFESGVSTVSFGSLCFHFWQDYWGREVRASRMLRSSCWRRHRPGNPWIHGHAQEAPLPSTSKPLISRSRSAHDGEYPESGGVSPDSRSCSSAFGDSGGSSSDSKSKKSCAWILWIHVLTGSMASSKSFTCFYSLKDADLNRSGLALTSWLAWTNHTTFLLSTWMTRAGPYHLPRSRLRLPPLRGQYSTQSPSSNWSRIGRVRLSKARLKLLQLSASMKACLAKHRLCRDILNWSVSDDPSSAKTWLLRDASAFMEAGNRLETPRTACSGVYPFTLDNVFFAQTAWIRCSLKASGESIGISWSMRCSIRLMIDPWTSVRPSCQWLSRAVTLGLIPFSWSFLKNSSEIYSVAGSKYISPGGPAQLNHDISNAANWAAEVSLHGRAWWNSVPSSKKCTKGYLTPFFPVQ